MIIAGIYSFNNGEAVVAGTFSHLLSEIHDCIGSVNAEAHRTKQSHESIRQHRMLYSPSGLNSTFKSAFLARNWNAHRVQCDYPIDFYTDDYEPRLQQSGTPYREMDFVKDGLGVEVQFGKYAFMVYNVCAKMTIFRNMDVIRAGVEIVPVRQFAKEMSSGVSYFEQFVWDLQQRGVADIDVPVLILGVDR